MCKHYNFKLRMIDRHFVRSEKHNNCVLCLTEKEAPMTQEKVAKYLGIGKMRVCQIEKEAIKKLKQRMVENNILLFTSTETRCTITKKHKET